MANKKLICWAITLLFGLLAWPGAVFAVAPEAYVTYSGQDDPVDTVDITVHFDGQAGYTIVQYATAMDTSGSDLQWSGNMSISGSSPDNTVLIENANKYMNYFVKISNTNPAVTEATSVKIYPVNTGTERILNDNAHAYYNQGYMCGSCHVTHSGLKDRLLLQASYYELCMLCHSTANSQSKYDVESGQVAVLGGVKASLAGPFVNQNGVDAVSMHNANDTEGISSVAVPGSDVTKPLGLTCVSCHLPHGGTDDNYRLLKKTIYAADGDQLATTSADVDAYAITDTATSGEKLYMIKGNTEFCAACHLDYDDGNAHSPGGMYAENINPAPGIGPGTGRYRHPVSVNGVVYSVYGNDGSKLFQPTAGDDLPLQYFAGETVTADKRTAVVCSTCHYAHGSIKSFNIQGAEYDGKYMLRLDNYGACESCHKK